MRQPLPAATLPTLPALPLPPGVRSRTVRDVNGLDLHLLEAGHDTAGGPAVLLLHGFPELAYSWRHVLPALAQAGFHAIAPDQRGYGRSTGWDAGADSGIDADMASFGMLNLARDALGLVFALGHRQLAAVVGHDFGAPVAAWCALLRPDICQRLVLMSAPFGGPPALPFGTANPPAAAAAATARQSIDQALATLPRPRKHYQWHFAQAGAASDLAQAPQGVHDLLRAYYHHKSADWVGNQPHALAGWTAAQLARLPTYYVMDAAMGMAQTVAQEMPSTEQIAACRWLPEDALRVYSSEYQRTGFQGGLNWYRAAQSATLQAGLQLFSGLGVQVPAIYIAGASDWGTHQKPGTFEAMQGLGCRQLRAIHLLPGAGHWVQQEQPEAVNRRLLDFLRAG